MDDDEKRMYMIYNTEIVPPEVTINQQYREYATVDCWNEIQNILDMGDTVENTRESCLQTFRQIFVIFFRLGYRIELFINNFVIEKNIELVDNLFFLQSIMNIISDSMTNSILYLKYEKNCVRYRHYIDALFLFLTTILTLPQLTVYHIPLSMYMIDILCLLQPMSEHMCGHYKNYINREFIISMNTFGRYLLYSTIPHRLQILDVLLHIDDMYEITIGYKNTELLQDIRHRYKVFIANKLYKVIKDPSMCVLGSEPIRFLINRKSL